MAIETKDETQESETLKILRRIEQDIAEIKANQRSTNPVLGMAAIPETEEELLQMLIEGEESGMSERSVADIIADARSRNG